MSACTLLLPNGEEISYQLDRRSRRTLGLKIGAQGLEVHAPNRISKKQIETLLLSKANWILKKLEAQKDQAIAPITWQDGTQLMLLGSPLHLIVNKDTKSRAVKHLADTLTVALPNTADINAIEKKVLLWYRKQALSDFSRRIEILAAKLGVPTPKLLLSNARTRWGSCNSKKEIRLSWRLIQAPPHIINYVTAHELSHLKQMNHSVKFWATVESIYPEYKKAEKDLKALSPLLHQI